MRVVLPRWIEVLVRLGKGVVLAMVIVACNTDSDTPGQVDSNTGSITFAVRWPGSASSRAETSGLVSAAQSPSGDVCVDYEIGSVSLKVLNSSNVPVASKSFACSDHAGTVSNIPTGTGMSLELEGIVSGEVSWRGQVTGLTVSPDNTTNAGVITVSYIGDDATPPSVVPTLLDPTHGARDVPLNQAISLTFSEPVVEASVRLSLTVTRTSNSNPEECEAVSSATLDSSKTKATFPLNEGPLLCPLSDYTATIQAGVQDLAAKQMASEFNWSFTTANRVPIVSTSEATSLLSSSATVNGTVNPNGLDTTVRFEWGTDQNLLAFSRTSEQTVGSGTIDQTVTSPLTGLSPNTFYYYRVVASTADGEARGSILNFNTAHTVWIAEAGAIIKVSSAQEELLRIDEINCRSLRSDTQLAVDQSDGALWVNDSSGNVFKIDEQGELEVLTDLDVWFPQGGDPFVQNGTTPGIAVDDRDGSVWMGLNIEFRGIAEPFLAKLSSFGFPVLTATETSELSFADNSMSWYPGDSSLWVAEPTGSSILKLFGTDAELDGYFIGGGSGTNHLRVSGLTGEVYTVSAYPGDGSGRAGHVWTADSNGTVYQFSIDGFETYRRIPPGFDEVRYVSADIFDGSAWVAGGNSDRAAKYSATGDILVNVATVQALTIEANPFDGGAWVGSIGGLVKLSAAGQEEWRRANGDVRAIAPLRIQIDQNQKIHVSTSGSDTDGDGSENRPYKTIARGVSEANPGDTVVVAAGTYSEATLGLRNKVNIMGAGADVTTIESQGVGGNGIENVTISGFTIIPSTPFTNEGIGCRDCNRLIIRENRISNFELSGIGCEVCNGLIVKNNRIINNGDDGIYLGLHRTASIERNIITGNSHGGIYLESTSQAVIRNNIVTNNGGSGIFQAAGGLQSYIANNVIESNTIESGSRDGIKIIDGDVIITNNIVTNFPVGIDVGSTATATLSYNNVWNNFRGNYSGVSPGEEDISADPLYVNPAAGDYHLLAGSPSENTGNPSLNDAGVDCSLLTERRSDMGAYGGPWGNW